MKKLIVQKSSNPMQAKFSTLTQITDKSTYDSALAYVNELISEATEKGYLEGPDTDNDYIREIGRIGNMCADFETEFMDFKQIRFKSPLILSIERALEKRSIKQYQAAELLQVKESTLSQIMTGRRPVSMRMAKKLYKELGIDPKLILEFA
jgi:antitoxin component HigA of HigAB toxin-antitoxin module